MTVNEISESYTCFANPNHSIIFDWLCVVLVLGNFLEIDSGDKPHLVVLIQIWVRSKNRNNTNVGAEKRKICCWGDYRTAKLCNTFQASQKPKAKFGQGNNDVGLYCIDFFKEDVLVLVC